MADLNKVFLRGNLGQDPEYTMLSSGRGKLHLRVATKDSFKGRDGAIREVTAWHNVVVWGREADALSGKLSKGQTVFVEGKLNVRSYDAQDGSKRYTTEVVAEFVAAEERSSVREQRNDSNEQRAPSGRQYPKDEEDIPF